MRLREKGGKRHAMPCHHNLEEYLTAYLDGPAYAAVITSKMGDRAREDPTGVAPYENRRWSDPAG